MLTDVDGIYEVYGNASTKVTSLTVDKAQQMIEKNQITGGMIPKVKACVDAVNHGVKRTHIVNGKDRHSILIEIFTDKGIGTMVMS
jgi:acetylglutamate kinase